MVSDLIQLELGLGLFLLEYQSNSNHTLSIHQCIQHFLDLLRLPPTLNPEAAYPTPNIPTSPHPISSSSPTPTNKRIKLAASNEERDNERREKEKEKECAEKLERFWAKVEGWRLAQSEEAQRVSYEELLSILDAHLTSPSDFQLHLSLLHSPSLVLLLLHSYSSRLFPHPPQATAETKSHLLAIRALYSLLPPPSLHPREKDLLEIEEKLYRLVEMIEVETELEGIWLVVMDEMRGRRRVGIEAEECLGCGWC